MIPDLRDWKRKTGIDCVELYPDGGRELGGIQYHERLRPLRPVSRLVADVTSKHPELSAVEVGAIRSIITHEGEFGALVSVAARLGERPVRRELGFVFGDDFYARVNGVSVEPALFERLAAAVQELVLRDTHGLGIRRRRFLYQPPAGWNAYPLGFQTNWFPPDYPGNDAVITVWPASPRVDDSPAALADAMLVSDKDKGFTLEHRSSPAPISAQGGLAGVSWELVGKWGDGVRTWRDLVVLEDKRYLYALRLDTMTFARRLDHRKALAALVTSCYPLPVPSNIRDFKGIVDHWSG